MLQRLLLMVTLAFVPALALWSKAPAQGAAGRLKAMSVRVWADTAAGIKPDEVRAAVESRLRAVGIRIDPKSRDALEVVIAVSVILNSRGSAGGYAYSVHVSLNQQVYLARNPNVMTRAATWETMSMRTSSLDGLRAACREDVARRIEEFVAVYREAEPEPF